MGLAINLIRNMNAPTHEDPPVTFDFAVYVDADGNHVEGSDPRAAFLFAPPGTPVATSDARRLGLLDASADEDKGDADDALPEFYEDWTSAQLAAELRSRGLSVKGNKDALVARLVESDENSADESKGE